MAKKQIKCQHCAKSFPSTQINVWVVKQRTCPDCKNPLVVVADKLICGKCGKVIERKDTMAVAGLGVTVIDATTDYHKRDAYNTKGFEVEKRVECEKQLCARCLNTRHHIENVLQEEIGISKETMKAIRSASDIEFYQDFYAKYQPMIQRMLFDRAVRDGKIKLKPKEEPKGIKVKLQHTAVGSMKNATVKKE
jgi:hypothetical protein